MGLCFVANHYSCKCRNSDGQEHRCPAIASREAAAQVRYEFPENAPYQGYMFQVPKHHDYAPLRKRLLADAGIPESSAEHAKYMAVLEHTLKNGTKRLKFECKMLVCGCHIGAEDVEQEPGQRGGFRLKKEARLRSPPYLNQLEGSKRRADPIERCTGFTEAAKKFRGDLDAAEQRVRRLQDKDSKHEEKRVELQEAVYGLESQLHVTQHDFQEKDKEVTKLEGKIEKLQGENAQLKHQLQVLAAAHHHQSTASLLKENELAAKLISQTHATAVEREARQVAERALRDLRALLTPEAYCERFCKLRELANQAVAQGGLDFSAAGVQKLCRQAGAQCEFTRLVGMMAKRGCAISVEEVIGPASGKRTCRIRRIVGTFLLGLGATSERFNVVVDALDRACEHTGGNQALASGWRFGKSKRSTDRDKKINPCKDIALFWMKILVSPLHTAATGKPLKAKPHLKELIGLLEPLNAAWIQLRSHARPRLLALASRFDASAVLWFFENCLPLSLLLYDIVLKAPDAERYWRGLAHLEAMCVTQQRRNYDRTVLKKIDSYLYLKRTGHSLYKLVGEHPECIDEAFLEGGVNAKLAARTKTYTNEEEARASCLRMFAKRTDSTIKQAKEAFTTEYGHLKYMTKRDIEDLTLRAGEVIVSVIERICNATEQQKPYRVNKRGNARRGYTCDAWVCPTLIPSAPGTKTVTQLYSHEIGSPAFSLFSDTQAYGAPDSLRSANGCNMDGCAGSMDSDVELRQLLCGHKQCSVCGSGSTCPKCSAALKSRIRHLATDEAHQLRTRVITLDELKFTKGSEQDKQANGANEDGSDDEDDDDRDEDEVAADSDALASLADLHTRLCALPGT